MQLKNPLTLHTCLLSLALAPAGIAATHTWTGTATGTYNWAAGTNWSSIPVSNLDTILSYNSTLAAGVVIVSNNDVASPPFKLNQLSFTNVGPGSGTAPTLTLQGNQLEFITNSSAATPTLTFNTTGTVKPTIEIKNNLLLTNNLGIAATTNGILSGAISGGGSLTKSGGGTVTLTGSNNYTGTTQINAGNLTVSGAGALTGIGNLTLSTGTAATGFTYSSSATSTVAAILAGNGSSRTATINQSNGRINATSLTLGNGANSAGNVNLSGGTLAVSGNALVGQRASINWFSRFNLSGTGTLTAGSLIVGAYSSGGHSNGLFNQTAGTATISGALNLAANSTDATLHVGTVNLSGGTLTAGSITRGTSSGGGTHVGIFNFNGGTLKPGASTASFMTGLTSANIYGGGGVIDTDGKDITIGQALLATNNNGVTTVSAISGGSGYTANSVTLAVTFSAPSGANPRAASGYALTNATGNVTSIVITDPGNGYTSAPTFTVASGGTGASGTVSLGLPTDISTTGGGFTKQGLGTLTLSGTNTYTGNTNITAGKLVVNGSISTSLLTTVDGAATLAGIGTVGAATINGSLAPGDGGIESLDFSGDLTLAGASVFEINASATTADLAISSALLTFGGTLNVTNIAGTLADGQMFDLFNWASKTGTFSSVTLPTLTGGLAWDQSQLYTNGTITVVPEPRAAMLGLIGMLNLLRRRRIS